MRKGSNPVAYMPVSGPSPATAPTPVSPRLTEVLEASVGDLQSIEAVLSNIEYRLGLSEGSDVTGKDESSSLPVIAFAIQQRAINLLRRVNAIQSAL